ncbi:MAG: alcohol dehydrogenase catalytic domain-containing protein [Planctomycetota bacterium]|nr:alcohol dehydrogenase catalytic domain-containing protein [Planctomycetota bacterium]
MSVVLAAVMPEPGVPIELREIAEPELQPGSALLKVELSEVCGTDVYLQQGRLAGVPYPIIPGHVSIGRLEKIRGELLDDHGQPFAEGDRETARRLFRELPPAHRVWSGADLKAAQAACVSNIDFEDYLARAKTKLA